MCWLVASGLVLPTSREMGLSPVLLDAKRFVLYVCLLVVERRHAGGGGLVGEIQSIPHFRAIALERRNVRLRAPNEAAFANVCLFLSVTVLL